LLLELNQKLGIARGSRSILGWLLAGLLAAGAAQAQERDAANSLLLVAAPELLDPNFRENVVLVTQAPDHSTAASF
jgi:hypothetical protein